jgi:hypothetical protein
MFVFIVIIVMDLISSGFYIYDYFSTLSISGLMRILEIRNPNEMRPILEMISLSTRSAPQLIMFAATSKCVFFLILNVFLLILFPSAVWTICTENQAIIKIVRSAEARPKTKPMRAMSTNAPDVDARVVQVNYEQEEEEDGDNQSFSPQPAYNPYLTKYKSQETHF